MTKRYQNMPVIARRGKLKILMFYDDHAPPHIHIDGGGNFQIVVNIQNPTIQPKIMTKPDRKTVLSWIVEHEEELLEYWDLASEGTSIEDLPQIPFP